MMVLTRARCHLAAEADMALQVQEMMGQYPSAYSFQVQDNSHDVQSEALEDLDLLSDEVCGIEAFH